MAADSTGEAMAASSGAQSVAIVDDPTTLYTETVSTTLRQTLETRASGTFRIDPSWADAVGDEG